MLGLSPQGSLSLPTQASKDAGHSPTPNTQTPRPSRYSIGSGAWGGGGEGMGTTGEALTTSTLRSVPNKTLSE